MLTPSQVQNLIAIQLKLCKRLLINVINFINITPKFYRSNYLWERYEAYGALGALNLQLKLTFAFGEIRNNASSRMKHLQKLNGYILPSIEFEDPKYNPSSVIESYPKKNVNLYYNRNKPIQFPGTKQREGS